MPALGARIEPVERDADAIAGIAAKMQRERNILRIVLFVFFDYCWFTLNNGCSKL